MSLRPDEGSVERFRRSLATLVHDHGSEEVGIGVAVSGGPDSVALLLLAAAALPGRVAAATVDHGLRAEAADEARAVSALCDRLGLAHSTLRVDAAPPTANRQAWAREVRYPLLARWASERGLAYVATAHHLDDQAETLLMRLHRGAGVGGLAGIRSSRPLIDGGGSGVRLIRPLLDWRREALGAVVADAAVAVADDPSNRDPAYDRTAARAFLARSPDWPDRRCLAASALALADADRALDWAAAKLVGERACPDGDGWTLDVAQVPPELRRRMTLDLIRRMTPGRAIEPRGDRLSRALALLQSGRVATLAEVVIRPGGERWRFEPAPPRRSVN